MLSPEKRAPLTSISSSLANNVHSRSGSENAVLCMDERLLDELQDILVHNVCKVDVCQRGLEILDAIRTTLKSSSKCNSLRIDVHRAQKLINSENDTIASPSKIQRLESEFSHASMTEDELAHQDELGVMHWDMMCNDVAPLTKPTLTRDDSLPMQLDDVEENTTSAMDARTARRRRRASVGSTTSSSGSRSGRGRGRKNQSKYDDSRDSPIFMTSPAESKQPNVAEAVAASYAEEKCSAAKENTSEHYKEMDQSVDRLSPPADIAMPLDEEEENCGIVTFDIQSSPLPVSRPVEPSIQASVVATMFTFNSFSSARDILNDMYAAMLNNMSPAMESVPAVVFLLTLSLQIENNSADTIRTFALKYLSSWLQCLETMRSVSSTSSIDTTSALPGSPSKQKKRRIKFKEICAASTSPPNDRLPNSHEEFEKISISMFDMLEHAFTICKACTESKDNHLLRQFAISLHVMSYRDNVTAALRALEAHSGMQIGDVHQVEVADLASLLHEELTSRLKDTSVNDNVVSLCSESNARSLLRHRGTWMMVAVMRYHLRWLLDEPPSRATTVVLTGTSPADSCRSELFTKVQVSPCNAFGGALDKLSFRPGTSAIAPFNELPPSTIFVQGLQQYFEGINFVLKGTHHIEAVGRWSDTASFFGVIRDVSHNFKNFVSDTIFDLETLNPLDAKLLYTAQVALAAESARDFLSQILATDVIWKSGESSGVWKKLEQFGQMILAHGLPEDMHYGLLADFSLLCSVLSRPLLSDVNGVIDIINKFVKSNGGIKKGAALKKDTRIASGGAGDIFDLLDKCPFVFEFPRIIEKPTYTSTTLPAPNSSGDTEMLDNSWMLVDEMKLSDDVVF